MAKAAAKPRLADESALVARALEREPEAIRLIMQQHNQRLYRLARSILRDDDEAEDALQEAYARAFTSLHSFRQEAQLGTWLTRILLNEAFGRLRRRRAELRLDAMAGRSEAEAAIIAFPHAAHPLDPEKIMAQREIRLLVERAIDALPEDLRIVLVARLVQEMSVEETAEAFGILPVTVKTRLHRARRRLRKEMSKHIGPVLGHAFPFAGRRCERFTETVMKRLGFE